MEQNCTDIALVAQQIVEMIAPEKIILFNRKTSLSGQTNSFKLCVVANVENRRALEQQIYLEVDCEVPFDVVIYTTGEWAQLLAQEGTFVKQVQEHGTVLHG